jgi:N-acylneuraminate cytidylyltransferase
VSELTNIAVIPARAGSKRIPNKNIRKFDGKPIIFYPIQAALEAGIFSKVIVSTNSTEIADIAQEFGAECLSLRPELLSGDEASTIEVIQYEISRYKNIAQQFQNVACIYPATPMLTGSLIKKAMQAFNAKESDFCFPIVRNHVSSDRELILQQTGLVTPSKNADLTRNTQYSMNSYRDAGQFYLGSSKSWLRYESIFSARCLGIEIPEYLGIDIDEESNWRHAELIYAGIQRDMTN